MKRKTHFSFRRFLRSWKDSNRKPVMIHDDETFKDLLELTMTKEYTRGPRNPNPAPSDGYTLRLKRDVVDPWAYDLKRRALVARIIEQRESALKQRKLVQEIENNRVKSALRAFRWRKLHGKQGLELKNDWHKESVRLFDLKRSYWNAREQMFTEMRQEFLDNMNPTHSLWEKTPDECKFLRFRFGLGVSFPFTNAEYN